MRNDRIIDGIIKAGSRRVTWRRIMALLCVITVLMTTNQLMFKADTLERIPACGYAEHVHDESCFDGDSMPVCGLEEHTHTDACYQQRPHKAADEIQVALEPPVEEVEMQLGEAVETGEVTETGEAAETGEVEAGEDSGLTIEYEEPAPTEIIAADEESADEMSEELFVVTEAGDAIAGQRTVALDFTGYIATDAHTIYFYDADRAAVLVMLEELAEADGVAMTATEGTLAAEAMMGLAEIEAALEAAPEDIDALMSEVPVAYENGVLIITGDGEVTVDDTLYTISGLTLPARAVRAQDAAGEITVSTADGQATLLDVTPAFTETASDTEAYADVFDRIAGLLPENTVTESPEEIETVVAEAGDFRLTDEEAAPQRRLMAAAPAAETLPRERMSRVLNMRLFDIALIGAYGATEPGAPIHVETTFNAPISGEDFALYHIVDGEPVRVEDAVVVDENNNAIGLSFDTPSLSPFAVAYYTVDFSYVVDGQVYAFSLPGGGFVTLRSLLEVLGIAEGIDVDDIESATFSDPALVWVGQALEDGTVGQVKAAHALECIPSAELTRAQLEEIDSTPVSAGEWLLISLKPFDTEETLTVALRDGQVFTVKVTDAQITTLFLSASGELYEVTVTYGDDAQIPEGSRLVVTEYDSTSEEYLAAWDSVAGQREASPAETEVAEDDTIENQSGSFALAVSNPGENEKETEGAIIIAENVVPYSFGMTAFDLSIYDSDGNPIEPKAAVEVSILVKELPADVEPDVLESSLSVQHLDESTGELIVETVASVEADLPGDIEIQEDSILVGFTVESFSTYTITWGGGLTGRGASSISSGKYIVYARDAYNGNYYALVPARNSNGSLQTVPLTYTNGLISYSGNTNLYWTVTVNNGVYTLSFRSGSTTYYMAAGTISANGSVISRSSTSNYNSGSNTTSFGQYADHLHCAGDTFLRCYNGSFQFIHDVSTGWESRSSVFFAQAADTKMVTVHYGYMDGNRFVEFDELPAGAQASYGGPTLVGDQLNVRYDIPGKDYVTTRINNPSTGTEISPLLQTEANSAAYWKYRILDTLTVNDGINAWQTFGTNDNDIYVIYRDTPTEKSYDDGGLTADDLAAPATNKGVQPNGDGTYDVSLSVTGTSNSKHNKTHANVVIVLDTSSSMNEKDTGVSGQTRLQAAQNAIYTLSDQLFGFNTSDDPAAIEIAFVDFSHRVRNEMTKDTIYSGVVNGTDYNSFRSLISSLNTNGGTNYDTAIEAANSVLWNDADPVYVIFVTDGDTVSRGYLAYDASGATDHALDWDGGTYYTHDPNATADEVHARARSAAKIQLNKLLANSNNKFYSIGVFGNVQYLEDLGGTYLGQANNEAAIKKAFATIIEDLALELGYKDVTIHDGITALTSTALVNGVADQFRYKITKKDGTVQTFDSDAALKAEYPGIGTATYTTNGTEKSVQWNLGANYQLEDGVTYQLTFTVWPSQDAYDYLADFNNRVKKITEQNTAVKKQFFVEVDGSTYQYVENKGWTTDIPAKEGSAYITDSEMQGRIDAAASLTHYIRTNTRASVDYTSVKTENGTVTETKTVTDAEIRDPNGKMVLDGTALKMKKAWNDSLSTSEQLELLTKYLNDAGTDTTYAVTLRLWQDKDTTEEEIHTATSENGFVIKPTVTIENGKVTAATWPTLDVSISPGVMVEFTTDKDRIYWDTEKFPRVTYGAKTYIILETGHNYNITEDDIDLHFELNADVYHPMVVNGVLKTVKFGTDASGNRIITEMSSDGTPLTTLTATNSLKGGLDVMKFVTTKDDASDTVTKDETYFTFRIKLQKSQTDTTQVYTTPDQFNGDGSTKSGSLGFRIFAAPVIPADATNVADDKSSYEFNGLTYKADRNSEGEINGYTARGTVPDTGELTLKIRQSKLGGTDENPLDRIRIVNIPAGTYYTVEEIDVPEGYTQVKKEADSGTVKANTQATAKFWNKRTFLAVDLLKVDEVDNSKVLKNAEFKLYKEDGTTEATDAEGKPIGTITTGSDGKATIGKLLPGTYKLIEKKAPEGYNLMTSPVTILVTNEKVTFQQGTKQPVDATKSSDGLTWTITATNNPGYELPSTGGPGTLAYTLTGALLILAAALLLLRRRAE